MDRIRLVKEAKMLSIVIPTYNEKDNIAPLLERIHGALPGIEHEVIFVDDSKDETPAVIEEIAKSDSTVVLHHRENEKGLATAVVKGFSLAKGDFVACMDADLQRFYLICIQLCLQELIWLYQADSYQAVQTADLTYGESLYLAQQDT